MTKNIYGAPKTSLACPNIHNYLSYHTKSIKHTYQGESESGYCSSCSIMDGSNVGDPLHEGRRTREPAQPAHAISQFWAYLLEFDAIPSAHLCASSLSLDPPCSNHAYPDRASRYWRHHRRQGVCPTNMSPNETASQHLLARCLRRPSEADGAFAAFVYCRMLVLSRAIWRPRFAQRVLLWAQTRISGGCCCLYYPASNFTFSQYATHHASRSALLRGHG